jgi:hypothetical protein
MPKCVPKGMGRNSEVSFERNRFSAGSKSGKGLRALPDWPYTKLASIFPLEGVSKDLHDTVTNRINGQVGNGVQIKFPHDVGSVSFGGLHAQMERSSDFLAGLALG